MSEIHQISYQYSLVNDLRETGSSFFQASCASPVQIWKHNKLLRSFSFVRWQTHLATSAAKRRVVSISRYILVGRRTHKEITAHRRRTGFARWNKTRHRGQKRPNTSAGNDLPRMSQLLIGAHAYYDDPMSQISPCNHTTYFSLEVRLNPRGVGTHPK